MKNIRIEKYSDGSIFIDIENKRFNWDRDDKDMGTESIKKLLEYLGHNVTLEEGDDEQ